MRVRIWLSTAVATVLLLSAVGASAQAAAPRAGWQLYANSFPTNLVSAVDEVQEIEVTGATGGTLMLLVPQGEGYEETAAMAYPTSAATVEAELDALPAIGGVGGSVTVTGGPERYVLSFSGSLAHTRVGELIAEGSGLTGPAPEAVASVKTPGGAGGTIAIDVFNVGAGDSSGTITVTDRLPSNVRAVRADALVRVGEGSAFGVSPQLESEIWDCTGNGPGPAPSVAGASVVTCVNDPSFPHFAGGGGLPTEFPRTEAANPQPPIGIVVEATGSTPEARHTSCPQEAAFCNQVSIAGGGALEPAATEDPITFNPAPAPGGLTSADSWFSNADGTVDRQAGSHPYTATFAFTNATALTGGGPAHEGAVVGSDVRNLETEVPPGLVGNLSRTPQCRQTELLAEECPPGTMVGRLLLPTFTVPISHQVFNMVPPAGTPAELGIDVAGTPALITFGVKSGGDYRIVAQVPNTPQRNQYQTILTLWGTPQESSHDRWRTGADGGCTPEELEHAPEEAEIDRCSRAQGPILKPFLTLPTSCSSPQSLAFRELSGWQEPDATSEVGLLTHDALGAPAGFTGCEALGFEPAIRIAPETTAADTPTGLTATVNPSLGGLEEPGALSTAAIRNTTVALPQGFVVNPGQATGLAACPETAAASAIGTENAPNCPAASKIGTVKITSPLLEGALEKQFEGDVYLLQSNPPQLHLLLAASADGINLKLVGIAKLDPQTGRLVASFGEDPQVEAEDPFLAGHMLLPQLPASELKLTFNGGDRAALATPSRCGHYQGNADFTPYSSPATPNSDSSPGFDVTSGPGGSLCPSGALPFGPTLKAGVAGPWAGKSSTFTLNVSRTDGQQNIKTITSVLPEGQLAKLAGVPLCPESAATSGNCPSASQVGSVTAAIGPGGSPLQVPQPGKAPTAVYLAGPYKGAPYSLVVKVPAQAGPFDLGTVITRVALQVNESTTQVTAVSDPLPQILDGVPLSYKSITVAIDRPGFIQNPTNCQPKKVTATIGGSEGANATLSAPYQVGDCGSLAFKPSLKLSLKGSTKRSGVPALKAVLTLPKGNNANISSVSTVLPPTEFIDNAHIGNTCTRVQFNAGAGGGSQCPAKSILGHAIAYSPLLEKPLEGTVYFRSNGGERELPDLVAALRGQINVNLVGFIDSVKKSKNSEVSRLRTRFLTVPDAPVSRFVLQLAGAKHGLLENSKNLCKSKNLATVKMVGQNGKTFDSEPAVTNDCGKKSKSGKKKQRRP
jgi:hypothetical protein